MTADVRISEGRIDALIEADRVAEQDTVVVDVDASAGPAALTDEYIANRITRLRRAGDGLTEAETAELAALVELHRWRAIEAGALPADEVR